MVTQDEFDFESFKKEAIAGLYSGRKMTGSNGVLAPMMKHFLESMMAGELEHHLSEGKRLGQANRKNGRSKKTVRSLSAGEFELETGRDRLGTFDPKIVAKRQLIITEELEGHILSMYAMGMSTRAMRDYVQEMYAMDISPAEVSRITDSVLPAVQEWRNRPLEAVYPFVFLDCMFFKVRVNGAVETRAAYNILGIDIEGKKEVLGLYTSENEGAKFWLSVLTDLKARGIQDMLIACIDGLKGFPEAVEAVFPKTRANYASFTRSALRCVIYQKKTRNWPWPI